MKNKDLLKKIEKPLAIAMWDFSWMLSEGFGDIIKALDELVERGYNAIRIDVFPASINTFMEKGITTFTYSGTGERNTVWGNINEVRINTPEKVELIFRECIKRNIYIGISSWITFAAEDYNDIELNEFIKIWDSTLKFLDERDLLHNIIYVDLMNEYPVCNGFKWLRTKALNKAEKKELTGMEHVQVDESLKFDDFESKIWRDVSAELLDYFHTKWRDLDFTISIIAPTHSFKIDKYVAVEKLDTIDAHLWIAFHADLFANFHLRDIYTDEEYLKMHTELFEVFDANRDRYIQWIDECIAIFALEADKHGLTIGNTEGWGLVVWRERPSVNWNFIKIAAELIIPVCKKYKCFKYICTSNFTHPMFKSLWADIEWHKKVTEMIKS